MLSESEWVQTDSWIRAELLKPPLRYVRTKFSVPINSTSSCMHVPEVSVDGRRRWWQHQSGQWVCEVGRKSECHKCRPVIVVCIWWSGEIPIVKEAVMACRNKVQWFSAFSVLATYKQFQGWGETKWISFSSYRLSTVDSSWDFASGIMSQFTGKTFAKPDTYF